MRQLEITGQKFNMLKVICPVNVDRHGAMTWLCLCDCGNYKVIKGCAVRSGTIKSCSCLKVTVNWKHGHARRRKRIPEYATWSRMIQRCHNPNNTDFSYYGGRGITVCRKWLESFEQFFNDMGARPTPKHTIDRINNDGNYEPTNCRWATRLQQTHNRRMDYIHSESWQKAHSLHSTALNKRRRRNSKGQFIKGLRQLRMN